MSDPMQMNEEEEEEEKTRRRRQILANEEEAKRTRKQSEVSTSQRIKDMITNQCYVDRSGVQRRDVPPFEWNTEQLARDKLKEQMERYYWEEQQRDAAGTRPVVVIKMTGKITRPEDEN